MTYARSSHRAGALLVMKRGFLDFVALLGYMLDITCEARLAKKPLFITKRACAE